MNTQQIETLTEQLRAMEPLRTAKNGPELYGVLHPLSTQLRRLLQGPWSHDEMNRVGAFAAVNVPPDPEPDPALAEADAALVAARAEFDRAEELWQKATVALLTLESKSRAGQRDTYGNVVQVPARILAELRQAKADQAAARTHREEALEARQAALVARNKLERALQEQRYANEYRAALAAAEAEKQAKQRAQRAQHEASLERLSSMVIS